MEELYREYGIVRANRVKNSDLTFDFSKPNMNGILVIGFIVMTILAFITKKYSLLLFDPVVIIYFIIVKIQNQKINFRTGFISFKDNYIIRKSLLGNEIIDCTKNICIYIRKKDKRHGDYDEIDIIDEYIFKEEKFIFELVVGYIDDNNKEQDRVLARTSSNNSKDEFERFITNFYYEEEPKENKENIVENDIRFCI